MLVKRLLFSVLKKDLKNPNRSEFGLQMIFKIMFLLRLL